MATKAQLQAFLDTLEVGQHFTLADVAASGVPLKDANQTLNKYAYKGELVRKVARPQDHSGSKYHSGVATWSKR